MDRGIVVPYGSTAANAKTDIIYNAKRALKIILMCDILMASLEDFVSVEKTRIYHARNK